MSEQDLEKENLKAENKHLTIIVAVLAIILIAILTLEGRSYMQQLEKECQHGNEVSCQKYYEQP